MAKRFTDTNKYKKPFIRSLPGAYKILWDFLYHDCDHAGIWTVDFETAQIYVGKDMVINRQRALDFFNEEEIRVVELDHGKKWFLPGFIDFQYGQLSEKNRAHQSVILLLKKLGVLNTDLTIQKENKPLTSPLQGAMDMDKDKDMDKDMDKEGGVGDFVPDIPGDSITLPVDTQQFRHHWTKWKHYRRSVHNKVYAMHGEQAALDRLKGFTEQEAIDAINQAISSKWFNIYPDSKPNGKVKREPSFKLSELKQ